MSRYNGRAMVLRHWGPSGVEERRETTEARGRVILAAALKRLRSQALVVKAGEYAYTYRRPVASAGNRLGVGMVSMIDK